VISAVNGLVVIRNSSFQISKRYFAKQAIVISLSAARYT